MIFQNLTFIVVSLFLATVANAAANTPDVEMKKTLACHKSFKAHAHSNYEVWDKDGLIFGRWIGSRKVEGMAETQSLANLSFTDGKNVILASLPSGLIKRKDGGMTSKFYYHDHIYKLQLPPVNGGNAKTYCVNYRPQLGNDELKRFEATPPAICDDAPVVEGQLLSNKEALDSLYKIQRRLADSIDLQLHKQFRCREEKSCSHDKDEDRLIGFDPTACRGLSGPDIERSLKKYDAFVKKYGTGAVAEEPQSGGGVE